MANRKVSIGTVVECNAEKILGKKRARNWLLEGQVLEGEVTGRGTGCKWKVAWKLPDGSSEEKEHGARVLTLKSAATSAPSATDKNIEDDSMDLESSSTSDSSDDEDSSSNDEGESQSDDEAPQEGGSEFNVNGLQWMQDPLGVVDDWRAQAGHKTQEQPSLNWRALGQDKSYLGEHSRLDYFLLFMPNIIDLAVKETSKNLENAQKKATSKHELLKTIGILFALGIGGKRTRRDNWSEASDTVFPPAQFGDRYGIGYHRFEDILNYWQWYETGSSWDNASDPWKSVRFFQHMFNERVNKVFSPGYILCVDESTIRWYGFEEWHSQGCPHVTKIPRKPENVSVEVRCIADGDWEVCLWIEIQEGSAAMEKKAFVEAGRNTGTAFVLRATQAWHGTGKVVVGDSAFASVMTAVELRKVGLYFTGIVKNARKFFPTKKLRALTMTFRGETIVVTAVKTGVQLMAIVWNEPGKENKPRKLFISSWGTSLAAAPILRLRYNKIAETGIMEPYYREIPIVNVTRAYFDNAGAVDHFNRTRQDGIRIERNVEFKQWDKRVLSSFFGFVGANAYHAYRGEGGLEGVSDFMEGLTLELLQNPFAQLRNAGERSVPAFASKRQPEQQPPPAELAVDGRPVLRHVIRPLTVLAQYANSPGAKLTCKICKEKSARYFCVSCSNVEQKLYVPLCGARGDNDCQAWHIQLS
jgi:hypothetical protein